MKKKLIILTTVILLICVVLAVLLLSKPHSESNTEEISAGKKNEIQTDDKQTEDTVQEMPKETKVGYYLDTVITLTAYTDRPELLEKGLELCGEYEKVLSRTIEGSDVWKMNHADGKTVTVSNETAEILQTAIKIGEKSGGAFDITIAPVSTLWDFTSGKAVIPDTDAIEEAVRLVDFRKIRMDGNNVTLPSGMMIDLGGIAKGYIADAVRKKLEEDGIKNAILSFGGNIVAIGLKPDGSPWKVGIQDIDEPTGKSMMVSLNYGGSTVTSGIYERGFTVDGVTYHHILSSQNGWPIQNGLASVTIFSDSSMTGDALSTAVFALGKDEGARLVESLDGVEALFIDQDRNAFGTSGLGKYMAEGESWTAVESPTETEGSPQNDPSGENTQGEEPLTLLIQVRESDTAPGYILLQSANSIGFLTLPEEGEVTKTIRQRLDNGSEWLNVIRMTPEGFCMIEADCEGHDCIAEGEVTLDNMKDRLLWNMVICAPHQLTLSLYTKEEAIAISRQWLGY